jgi:hypothetical protein
MLEVPAVFRLYTIAALLVAAALLRYAAVCWVAPFRDCRRCDGLGRIRSRTGRACKPCRRCHTTGKRLRAGRHIGNYLTTTRRAAKTADRAHTATTNQAASSTGPRR